MMELFRCPSLTHEHHQDSKLTQVASVCPASTSNTLKAGWWLFPVVPAENNQNARNVKRINNKAHASIYDHEVSGCDVRRNHKPYTPTSIYCPDMAVMWPWRRHYLRGWWRTRPQGACSCPGRRTPRRSPRVCGRRTCLEWWTQTWKQLMCEWLITLCTDSFTYSQVGEWEKTLMTVHSHY